MPDRGAGGKRASIVVHGNPGGPVRLFEFGHGFVLAYALKEKSFTRPARGRHSAGRWPAVNRRFESAFQSPPGSLRAPALDTRTPHTLACHGRCEAILGGRGRSGQWIVLNMPIENFYQAGGAALVNRCQRRWHRGGRSLPLPRHTRVSMRPRKGMQYNPIGSVRPRRVSGGRVMAST